MLEKFNLNHQPLLLEGVYDLNANFGLLNLQLPSREYLKTFDCWSYSRMFDHYNHYMWALWGKEVKWHSSDNNTIDFLKNEIYIDINMDSKNGYVENIKLNIEDIDTFLQFIEIFKNKDLSIKYCKSYRQWNKINDMSKASGIEIEIDSPKTPEKRRELIKKVKEHFGNNVYIETEANKDFPLEFTSNVVNIDNLEKTYDIVEFLLQNGCSFGDFSNIHIHVSKDYFGKNIKEIQNNLHKILILDYYHGKYDHLFNDKVIKYLSFTDEMCNKYKIDIHNDGFIQLLHNQFHDKNSSTKEDIYPRIDYFKWLRDPDNYHSIEFKWCSLIDKDTFEKSIKLLRQYLSVIKYSKKELFEICKKGEFNKIFLD